MKKDNNILSLETYRGFFSIRDTGRATSFPSVYDDLGEPFGEKMERIRKRHNEINYLLRRDKKIKR